MRLDPCTAYRLLKIVCRVAVESGEETASDPIGAPEQNPMLVCFGKPALEDELNDRMVQLPSTVCYDVCWWWDPKLLHICVSKAIRQLGEGDEMGKAASQCMFLAPWGGTQGGMPQAQMAFPPHT